MTLEARYQKGLCLLAVRRHHRAELWFRWVVEHAEDPSSYPAAHSAFLLLERRFREAQRGRGDRRMLIAAYERIAERGHDQIRPMALDRITALLRTKSGSSEELNRTSR